MPRVHEAPGRDQGASEERTQTMSEYEFEEKLFYGGQVSGKHPILQDLAMLASYGFPWWLINRTSDENWKKKSALEKLKEILKVSGQIEFINSSSELTKLSAIMGDTRKNYDQKGLRDELTKRIHNASKP